MSVFTPKLSMEQHVLVLLMLGFCPLSSCLYHQYHFVNVSMNWTQAQSYCRQNYTDLATIDGTEDNNMLVASATGYTGAGWIGLYFDQYGWQWSLDGSRVYSKGETLYTNWGPYQPNTYFKVQSCVAMLFNGQWFDIPCFYIGNFVCYDATGVGNRQYILINKTNTWTGARFYCMEHYTDLAIIRNQKENQMVQAVLPAYSAAWIGLYRDSWTWSDGGNSSFLNWMSGQPDNYGGDETCAVQWLKGGKQWSDRQCGEKFPFFCYSGPFSTTIPSTSATPSNTTTHFYTTAPDVPSFQPYSGVGSHPMPWLLFFSSLVITLTLLQ